MGCTLHYLIHVWYPLTSGDRETLLQFLDVLLASVHVVSGTVVRQPHRLADEEPLRLYEVLEFREHFVRKCLKILLFL